MVRFRVDERLMMKKEDDDEDLVWMAEFLNQRGSRYQARDWRTRNGCIVCLSDEESY